MVKLDFWKTAEQPLLNEDLTGETASAIVWRGIAQLKTFIEPKEIAENPLYQAQRHRTLDSLSDSMIDTPIIELINCFNKFPYCFTLQSCYVHFVCSGQMDSHNLEPLPVTDTIARVEYRLAYICFCIENSIAGKGMLEALKGITALDPENIQICSSEWFWKRHINTYALQVEPDRFKRKDSVILHYKEALHIETVRNKFFARLDGLLTDAKDR